MRSIIVMLIIILCLGVIIVPVIADKDDGGPNAGNAGPENEGQGQPVITGRMAGGADTPAELMQERTREENMAGNQSGFLTENPEEIRIQNKVENAAGMGKDGSTGQDIIRIRQNREEMNATIQGAGLPITQADINRNQVRLAVHTLLAMEGMTGGIGQNISAIARDFNNSALATWQLEVRIQNRDVFSRFFFGGDRAAAGELANLTLMNQDRIRLIEQLMKEGTLDAETRAMLNEQLQIMEKDTTRLTMVANQEKQDRGLFGIFIQ